MTEWCVADGDVVLGRYSEEDVRRGAARGDFPPWAKVWREGMADWAPIGRLFPEARKRARGRGFRLLGAWVLALAYLATVCVSIAFLYFDALSFVDLRTEFAVWLGVGLATGILALAAPLVWIRSARRGEGAGALRILGVLAMVIGVTLSAMLLLQAPAVWRLVRIKGPQVEHAFSYEPKSRVLSIYGEIGLGFAHDLRVQLERHPEVRRVDITSIGGLVEEALRAGRELADRKGLTVAARARCASACVIVLMGGDQRLADYDMDIEFHASAHDPQFDSPHARVGGRILDRDARRFMEPRGVFKKGLDEADRLGPGKLYRVPAADLVAGGMLAGLLDEDDRRLTPAQARARVLEEYGEPLSPAGPIAND
ncbi:MAG: DUF4339 domain-containing protein [Caulobacter sp.]